ncbi:MAG: hypothetical protein LCH20_05190 [Proteobacteria bacterium]|nr:hypothetical protein [Pseudomonadota bacterium]
MKNETNPDFLYRGNDIIKLWEQYLKNGCDNNGENIQFHAKDSIVDSIFKGLAQQQEIAIVLNQDGTLYKNKDGDTITLCGEIDYKPEDINSKVGAALNQITTFNKSNRNVITNHLVLFPYHVNSAHWNLGIIKLTINEGNVANHTVSVYEPYGGHTQAENYILNQITTLLKESIPNVTSINHKEQQKDGSSCGAITAENGKEFLKKETREQNLLEIDYPKGATDLRNRHATEINENAFYQAQIENTEYTARGDKSIENQFEIIKLLRDIINQPQNDWIKQVLLLTQNQNDEIMRENLDLFKKFLIQQNISGEIQQEVFIRILREDGGFKEGTIDLISTLTFNINTTQNVWIENSSKSEFSILHRQFTIKHTEEVAKEGDSKRELIKIKLNNNNGGFSRSDLEVTQGDFSYEYIYTIQRTLFSTQESIKLIGESNNLLFRINDFLENNYADIEQVFRKLNFDISAVLDSKGNNILHYAAFRYDLKLVSIIIHKAKADGVLSKLLHHRNLDGTNPLGMAFLFESHNLAAIEVARLFVFIPEYQISEYLNNKDYMDYSHVQTIGGTNILHNVILAASKCSKEAKESLSEFFRILTKRLIDTQEEGTIFNPNDPTMNPGKLTPNLDGHMISTGRLLESLKFSTKRIEILCKKYFASLVQIYETSQYNDSSGDSEDESSHAHKYREILNGFDKFTKQSLGQDAFSKSASDVNFQRTFDKYKYDYSYLSESLLLSVTSDNGAFDRYKWDQFWQAVNSPSNGQDIAIYKGSLSKMMVPLFHGVPFMHSQYTNYQRREIVEKIDKINRKLLGRYDGSMSQEEYALTVEEQILIGIHSRTATATCGMKSLHDVINSNHEDLTRLDDVDNTLQNHLTQSLTSRGFRAAMKNYVFNFADSPIGDFWQTVRDGVLPEEVVKYRFPVIATSKAPDHPIRFAIGRNVEGNRGEIPMQPEYDNDGYPTHRVAGLLYITMCPLIDLVQNMQTGQAIDINHAVKTGIVGKGRGFQRFANQLEMDFFGKIDSSKIVCIVPIIYPHIRDNESTKSKSVDSLLEDITYQISTFSMGSPGKKNVTSPKKLIADLGQSSNPDIMTESSNLFGFGKVMVPSITSIANGLVTSIASKIGYFLCSITDTNKLVPYNVKFDQAGQQFTKAQEEIKCETNDPPVPNPLWREVVQELINDSTLQEEFIRLSILGETLE